MPAPRVLISPELCGPYPAYFRANSGQIGDVIAQVAGLEPNTIDDIVFNFEAGLPEDDPFIRLSTNEFTISMRGIQRTLSQGQPLPASWHETFPKQSLERHTYFYLASAIYGLKTPDSVLRYLSDRHDKLNKRMGRTVLGGMLGATTGFALSSGNIPLAYVGGLIGAGSEFSRSTLDIRLHERRMIREVEPVVLELYNDQRVAEALKGALIFDFRG